MPKVSNKSVSAETIETIKTLVAETAAQSSAESTDSAGATSGSAGDESSTTGQAGSSEPAPPADSAAAAAAVAGSASTEAFVGDQAVAPVPGGVGGVLDAEVVQTLQGDLGPELHWPPVPKVIGYVVRCHRDRGIWRAGRFWPPENVPVPAEDLTKDQLTALTNEPLLSVQPVQE